MASIAGPNTTNPLLEILKANGIDPDMMVVFDDGTGSRKPTGRQTALQVLESYVGQALDIIEETESGQKEG